MIISKGQPIFKISPDERPIIESPAEIASAAPPATNDVFAAVVEEYET